ncbi:MAG: GNAT family N-acetyltransferase [Anaerolineaceae bacterium]|nr:GNAT family N-acetyltransferase [Anaerolineaceae bacterium]MDD4042785.1 GNAT family N-acetyltransferase [Anaerolineaceae bacterium]MDD4577382.1 GNAT family N-acetyltransferase [Anaerolineaceae bacterium]
MTIEIKPLSPEMAETFTSYVSDMDFNHAPHWQFCNCQYYHLKCTSEEWRARSAAQNMQLAHENIRNGVMKGFMAFDGDKPVGWVNANDWHNYALLDDDPELLQYDGKTGAIVCFLIHPEYRKQGLGQRLLETVVEDFRKQGFDRVAGRPFLWSAHPERQYHGVPNMFEALGFEKVSEKNGEFTYVLELK